MSVIFSIPIKPKAADNYSTVNNTHIDVNVDFYKADRHGEAGVKMSLYPVERGGGFVRHSIAFGMPSFPRTMIQPMAKNYGAKVQKIRENIREQFQLKHGHFWQVAMNLIAERGYEVEIAEALAMVDDDRR